jgi:hypothetical protein
MRSTLRIAACTAVVLSALSFGAASASAEVLSAATSAGRTSAGTTNAGAAVGVTVDVTDLAIGVGDLAILGSLPALLGLQGEPEWS